MRARVTAHARKAILEDAAREEFVGEALVVHELRRAELTRDEAKERRRLPGLRLVHDHWTSTAGAESSRGHR